MTMRIERSVNSRASVDQQLHEWGISSAEDYSGVRCHNVTSLVRNRGLFGQPLLLCPDVVEPALEEVRQLLISGKIAEADAFAKVLGLSGDDQRRAALASMKSYVESMAQ